MPHFPGISGDQTVERERCQPLSDMGLFLGSYPEDVIHRRIQFFHRGEKGFAGARKRGLTGLVLGPQSVNIVRQR